MSFVQDQKILLMNQKVKQQTFILVHPPSQKQQLPSRNIRENVESENVLLLPQKNTPIKNFPEFNSMDHIQAFSSFSSKSQADEDYIENEAQFQKKRAKKAETLKDIHKSHVDHGRGGNCVASNICKSLLRIVFSHIHGIRLSNFNHYTIKYQLKSQKQNSVIIILLLHIFAKQKTLSLQVYKHMINQFQHSLKESEQNCQRKMKDQEQRKSFHAKNKRMYKMFAQINREIFLKSISNINFNQTWKIKELQQMISNSYDRKQRQVEKAMNKLKSIIFNHIELKQWFELWDIDIEDVFFEAIEFAYRRNLPKRCKQIKDSAKKIIQKIKSERQIQTKQDNYMMCYMTLKLIGEKVKEIWEEFITNLQMKQEYNQKEEDRQRLRLLLEKQIPQKFEEKTLQSAAQIKEEQKVQKSQKNMQSQPNFLAQTTFPIQTQGLQYKCKIEEEQETSDVENNKNIQKKKKSFSQVYKEIRQYIDFET